jgi:hypothetical protein
MILEAALSLALARPACVNECPPPCQKAIITENSGNGPTYHVTICNALRKLDDARWTLIVDGSPLQNGAVIIGEKVPN